MNKKHELQNDIITVTWKESIEVSRQDFPNADKLVKSLTSLFWHLDCNHKAIINASNDGKCKVLPQYFSLIYAKKYRNFEEQKKAKAKLSSEKLKQYTDDLYETLSLKK